MKVKLLRDCGSSRGRKRKGDVIDHPDAWRLVLSEKDAAAGPLAEAVDDQAKKRLEALGYDHRGKRLANPPVAVPPPAVKPSA